MKSSEILSAAAKLLEDGEEHYGCDALWNVTKKSSKIFRSELFDKAFKYFEKYKPENPSDTTGNGFGWWNSRSGEDGYWDGEYIIVPERVQAMKNAAQDALDDGD